MAGSTGAAWGASLQAGLVEAAQARGKIRVIVELDTSFAPEGTLSGAAAAVAQRQGIGAAQVGILADLVGTSSAMTRQFRPILFIALEVDQAGLQALARSTRAVSVREDALSRPMLADSWDSVSEPCTARPGAEQCHFLSGNWVHYKPLSARSRSHSPPGHHNQHRLVEPH